MKKIIIILGIACISASAIAQRSVRIGTMEFVVKKTETDTITQVLMEDSHCPPCPQQIEGNNPKPKVKFSPYQKTHFFGGLGAVYPHYGKEYYTALGGKSFNVDAGWLHCNAITRFLALGGTFQYSFYNYELRDAAEEQKFAENVLGMKKFADDDIRRQVYRSHNIAASAFTRIYFSNYKLRKISKNRVFIDLGAQGDFALSKYYLLNTRPEGIKKYHEDYVFNPFHASAVARIGFGSGWSIFARYRLTEAFNKKELNKDLPPLTIGIHFL